MREFLKGLDFDKETIDTIMAEHGKLLTASKESEADLKEKLKAANEKLAAANKDIEAYKSMDFDGAINERDAEIAALRNEKTLRGHGLTDDEDIEIYNIRISKLVGDGKSFEQAAEEYFKARPVQKDAEPKKTTIPKGTALLQPDQPPATEQNPFQKGQYFNLTKQGQLIRSDPDKARQLAKEAGCKITI